VDLKLDRRGSSDSTKLDHHEIVCPTIGAVNVYLQVSRRHRVSVVTEIRSSSHRVVVISVTHVVYGRQTKHILI